MSAVERQGERVTKRPLRLLVICPSWLGDAVMATPALRLLRDALPGAFIGGLMRPGLDDLLAGTQLLDEMHVGQSSGVMGPKRLASKVRGRGYDTALLLTNSFSTALAVRMAFIDRRVGYDRDGRGFLLTDRIRPEKRADPGGRGGGRGFACVSAVEYYLRAARVVVGAAPPRAAGAPDRPIQLELGLTPSQQAAAKSLLERAGVRDGDPYAVINPGANNPAKRWPADRFAQAALWLVKEQGLKVLINGSPGEAELGREIMHLTSGAGPEDVVALSALGVTIGSLKGVVRGSKLMLTNDTGPRHIAAAFGVPTVTLYGPTDPRWTTLPGGADHRRVEVLAEPNLPEGQVADDHPDLCRIDRIQVATVLEAMAKILK